MMLDFNNNNGAYPKALVALWGGRVTKRVQRATSRLTRWKRGSLDSHPAGEPKYYLQLDEAIHARGYEKIGNLVMTSPITCLGSSACVRSARENCPCASSTTNYMAGGWYRDVAQPLAWRSPCQQQLPGP